jgi:hypothetical protein
MKQFSAVWAVCPTGICEERETAPESNVHSTQGNSGYLLQQTAPSPQRKSMLN